MHITLVKRDCNKVGGIKELERLHQAVLDEKSHVSLQLNCWSSSFPRQSRGYHAARRSTSCLVEGPEAKNGQESAWMGRYDSQVPVIYSTLITVLCITVGGSRNGPPPTTNSPPKSEASSANSILIRTNRFFDF